MGGEFRQRIAEVKGTGESGATGGWMAKTRLILAGVGVVGAVAGFALWFAREPDSPAEKLAKLPAAQQNVIIFDAAVDLLKANYFDPALFQKPEWQEYETAWREKAAKSQGGGFLYGNVLWNFGARFPDSHLFFQTPPPAAPPSTDEPASDPISAAATARRAALVRAGPGFDTAFVRRAGRTPVLVAEVLHGSPAARAGVTPGWGVEEFNVEVKESGVHFKATFLTYTPAVAREVERTGLPIASTAQQEIDAFNAAHSIEIAFDYEPLAPRAEFELRTLDDGITYLRFDHFNDATLIGRVLDAIDSAGPKGLIIDLRRNPGGLVLHTVRVAGRLLGGGIELGKMKSRGSSNPQYSLLSGNDFYQGPLVVLVGPSSGSAAEIIAAAVQDHRRGTLIGRTTNGSVVSASSFGLPDGGIVTIPMWDFVRAGDRRIEGVGVEPDVWILSTLEDVRAGRDPVLERALAISRE
jgi:carboxyl-terminal processing protease